MHVIFLTLLLAAPDSKSLLGYIDGRTDLSKSDRKAWMAQVKSRFGGTALEDSDDEAIRAARSVLSAAIFFEVRPGPAARGARTAYHDVLRFVPPPIAVQYQVLAFQGRKPSASPRQMAFDFPRHFDPEIAPELTAWWAAALENGRIPAAEIEKTEESLRQTRMLMRPLLLDRLWAAAHLQRRKPRSPRLLHIRRELNRTFAGVGPALERGVRFYAAYTRLAEELGKTPKPLDAIAPKVPPTPREPASPPTPDEPGTPAEAEWVPRPKGFAAALQAEAARWRGTPYRYGGGDRSGADCSGYARALIRKTLKVELPRTARLQATVGEPVPGPEFRVGDLLFFDTQDRGRINHVGVYLGDGRFTHASSSRGVVVDRLDKSFYQRAFRAATRLVDPSS